MAEISKKRAKILFILHMPPPVYGATIANEHIKNSKIINSEFDGVYIDLATNRKLNDVGKGGFKKLFVFLGILAKVIKALMATKFDLCLVSLTASGPAFYKDLVVVSILKLFNVKIVYYFHNKGVAPASASGINYRLYKFVFKNTKSILLAPMLYNDIEKFVSRENIYYCPYGIPIEDLSSLAPKQIVNGTCNLLFLSNMMVEKGILILLEACRLLKDKGLNFRCDFVGGWTDITPGEFDEYIIKYQLTDIIFVHGPKYNLDKRKFFSEADIFVFPTFYHYEAFPIVILEALQYGLPVVSTFEGGVPEEVVDGENGFLTPQKDINLLVEKLSTLITDPALRIKMGNTGKQRFKELFTLESFEKNICGIIRRETIEP